jgi:hypothetical protein
MDSLRASASHIPSPQSRLKLQHQKVPILDIGEIKDKEHLSPQATKSLKTLDDARSNSVSPEDMLPMHGRSLDAEWARKPQTYEEDPGMSQVQEREDLTPNPEAITPVGETSSAVPTSRRRFCVNILLLPHDVVCMLLSSMLNTFTPNRSRSSNSCERLEPSISLVGREEMVTVSMRNRDLMLLLMPSLGIVLGLVWGTHTLLVFWDAVKACTNEGACTTIAPPLDAITAGLHWRIDHVLHFLVDLIMFLALWNFLYPPKQ